MLHSLAKRQLKKLDLDESSLPDLDKWQQFLARVSQSYAEADRERYLLERSLSISSLEMQQLYESLQQSSETRLAEERDKLRTVISSIGDGLCAFNQDGYLLFINPAAERLLGWQEAELAGRLLLDMIGIWPQDQQSGQAGAISLPEIINSGQLYRSENGKFVRKNGTTFPTSFVLNPIMNEGSLLGAVLVFRDITERKRIETELQLYREHLEEQVTERTAELIKINKQLLQEIAVRTQAEEELRQARDQALTASRLKTELLAKVSHELRTPLNAILGYSELLEIGVFGLLSAEQKQITAKIIDSTQYLTTLVNELLDQAKLEAGKLELNIVPFAPAEMINELQNKMSVLAQIKGLTFNSSIAADMPAAIPGDQHRLQQILVNLVSNAIKFTDRGSVSVYLYQPDAVHWAMQISDTGPGIPKVAQSHIFEPFRQVDGSITRKHSGTGLGLSIVKQLTTLMGGEVIIESEIGQGSTFTISLPLIPVD